MRAIPGQPMGAVQLVTDGMRLVNRQGEAVRLRGINLIDKGSRVAGGWRFIPDWPEDLMDRFAQSGINLVRLGILWAAVEPSPGQYDETYFDFIGRQLDLAEQAGIAVILDMHQDLYAQRFSDGAPDWAVLTDKPYTPTPL
ncbi:MAG: cellulase family glycosylhydrolase, partial [Clostridiales bacterium]|nr:cellulase family glycosylhydrolase [Clostridiales bacterium]